MTGCVKDYLGFENFDSRLFLGKNILANIFWGNLSVVGIFLLFKTIIMKICGKELLLRIAPVQCYM